MQGKRQKGNRQMVIRQAQEKDIPELTEIYNYEILNTTATFDMKPKTLEERRQWFLEHNIGNHPLFVAEEEGHVAGYASFSTYRSLEAYHETVELSVYVDRKFRRRGTARRLLEYILEWGRQREDIHMVISVITGENEVSLHLHEEFGFTCVGTIRQAGKKFGRYLDIVNYQLIFPEK